MVFTRNECGESLAGSFAAFILRLTIRHMSTAVMAFEVKILVRRTVVRHCLKITPQFLR